MMLSTELRKNAWVFAQPLLFVILLWGIYGLEDLFNLRLYRYSLEPRNIKQLYGIVTFPLLHGSLEHIASNSISIFALLTGVRYFFPKLFSQVFVISFILPGIITWFIGRPSYHLGASGMIYALSSFLFVSGLMRSNRYLLALSMLVVFLYGSSFWYMFPIEENISWEGHLSGAITGVFLAILYRKTEPSIKVKEKEYFIDEEESPLIGDKWKENHDETPSHTQIIYHIRKESTSKD